MELWKVSSLVHRRDFVEGLMSLSVSLFHWAAYAAGRAGLWTGMRVLNSTHDTRCAHGIPEVGWDMEFLRIVRFSVD